MSRRPRRLTQDRGQVSGLVIGLALTVIASVGLVWDAGGMLIQRSQATTLAHEAARIGAQQLDLAHLRASGQRRLDTDAAVAAAQDYLAEAGATGQVEVSADTVTVTAQRTYTPTLLPLGSRTAAATATASARSP